MRRLDDIALCMTYSLVCYGMQVLLSATGRELRALGGSAVSVPSFEARSLAVTLSRPAVACLALLSLFAKRHESVFKGDSNLTSLLMSGGRYLFERVFLELNPRQW